MPVSSFPPNHGPHIHNSTGNTSILQNSSAHLPALMLQVMLALSPATLFSFWAYGWPSFILWLICLTSALLWESLLLKLFGKSVSKHLKDGSALVTAWILALCLPPWAPWWLAIVGTFLAIVIIKQIFGGLGQNVFNPAMAARVMLLIAFPVEMTQWINPAPVLDNMPSALTFQFPDISSSISYIFSSQALPDGATGATFLSDIKMQIEAGTPAHIATAVSSSANQPAYSVLDTGLGLHSGSLGEGSALLLSLGGLFLLWRGIITWQAPVGLLLGIAIPALLLNQASPELYPGADFHLLNGATMLAAWFIVTDPVTCPVTARGRLIFGLGCGLLAYLIRTFGNYPEGIAFAVMLMNSATPVIDRYIQPRIYGRSRRGQALAVNNPAADK
ncbi:RnfABCDGE type electron transport complex subunit D [Oceanospirillum sediminis]|uniref:Ion-translocating oxidoreductase complex subunit D n=1 Tax=Oceanospirillum sediminis TaxID=2760088 RepID=A0A839IP93_9GAMM|nr:RnfABCDGE type electron transport complex subunit D [Oceanospirillum sediminis]MBB1486494.1 RnfABCDGE type electron transport complex subunit D [Oceanospirillum sediminis]